MGEILGLPGGSYPPPAARSCAIDVKAGETFEAFPVLHMVNEVTNSLKASINDGQRGVSCCNASAYLGFRVISYTGIPLILNIVSVIVCAILTVLSLPFKCCSDKPTRWCWTHLQGSVGYTWQSLVDLTTDFRLLTGMCCCDHSSAWMQI